MLGEIDNAKINISSTGTPGTQESTGQSCGSFTQYCQDVSGKVGTQVCNAGTMNNGMCGYDPKVTTSCEACKI